jgi:hypothetical protein
LTVLPTTEPAKPTGWLGAVVSASTVAAASFETALTLPATSSAVTL